MFAQPDPIDATPERLGDPQQLNPYAYARGNPLKYVDPDGEAIWIPLAIAALWWAVDGSSPRFAHTPTRGEDVNETERNFPMTPLEATDLAAGAAGAAALGVKGYRALATIAKHADDAAEAANAMEAAAAAMKNKSDDFGKIVPTGDIDPAADALAKSIGGQPSVRIEGFGNREFDAVSDTIIGQTFDSASAIGKPHNFLSKSRVTQIRETLRAASETGRTALFEFTKGKPHKDVLDFIERNAQRAGVKYVVRY